MDLGLFWFLDKKQLPRGVKKNFLRKIVATESFFSKTAGLQSLMVPY